MGELDELSKAMGTLMDLGLLINELGLSRLLADIQQDLMDISGELSMPMETLLSGIRILALDKWIRIASAELIGTQRAMNPAGPLLKEQARISWAVCQKAVRTVLTLNQKQFVAEPARRYLSRLAELFNVLERVLRAQGGVYDV